MSSLFLPAPVRSRPPPPSGRATAAVAATGTATGLAKPQCPTYEERCDGAAAAAKAGGAREKLFVPRSVADFDDGGAFPEIHVAQYPRHMGNPHLAKKRAGGRSLLSVAVGAGGEASYDAVVTGGTNADKTVYASHSAVVPARPGAVGAGAGGPSAGPGDATALPTDDEERRTAERTLAALGQITQAKSDMARPTGSAIAQASTSGKQEDKTQFVRYKPREDAPGYNPAAAQRVVQMVPAQIDPMQPPKHMHRKAPRGPAEDPVPVLHAPPEKLSKEEREAWNVPACISNWKNTRGYTIPLDKRLAADGRGLREEATINSNFATLSESLYVAERQAREEVRMRSQVQKRLAVQEKERREEELRDLAARARRDRAGIGGPALPAASAVGAGIGIGAAAPAPAAPPGPTDEQVAAEQRERLRQERRRERERELREEKRGAGGGWTTRTATATESGSRSAASRTTGTYRRRSPWARTRVRGGAEPQGSESTRAFTTSPRGWTRASAQRTTITSTPSTCSIAMVLPARASTGPLAARAQWTPTSSTLSYGPGQRQSSSPIGPSREPTAGRPRPPGAPRIGPRPSSLSAEDKSSWYY